MHTEFMRRFLTDLAGRKSLAGRRCGPDKSIYELTGDIDCLLYIKLSNSTPPWWGVTQSRIAWLSETRRNWFLVLLHGDKGAGYLLPGETVREYITQQRWRLGTSPKNKNEYKVLPEYLKAWMHFETFDALIKGISCEERSGAANRSPDPSK